MNMTCTLKAQLLDATLLVVGDHADMYCQLWWQAAQRGRQSRLVVVDVEAERGPRDVGGVGGVLLLSDVVPVHVVDHGLAARSHTRVAESVG